MSRTIRHNDDDAGAYVARHARNARTEREARMAYDTAPSAFYDRPTRLSALDSVRAYGVRFARDESGSVDPYVAAFIVAWGGLLALGVWRGFADAFDAARARSRHDRFMRNMRRD